MAKVTLIDRAIGVVSPRAALRRVQARAAFEVVRDYAGADRGRLHASWRTRSSSANSEIARSGPLLRDRMRDLVRNNPLAANAVDIMVTHAVGDGIVPKFKDAKVRAAFKRWAKSCDAAGELDFYGIQALAVREMIEGGESLVRRVWRPYRPGAGVPLKLQVMEADQIDSTKDGSLSGKSNLVQGIELDEFGGKAAFWLFEQHPDNRITGAGLNRSVRVERADVAHLLEKQRTQIRGVPWGSPVITDLRELDGYKEAERVRKRLESCMVGIMTGGEDDDSIGLAPSAAEPERGFFDAHGQRVEKFSPGMFYNAVGGRDVKFTQPAVTGDYAEYIETEEHWIAAGFRMPHFVLTGRLDKVNYSSSKVGLEVYKRTISRLQWQTIVPMLIEPIIGWWLQAAFLAGEIDDPLADYEIVPPRFYSADPIKDLNALKAEIRSGLKSWQQALAERGEDADDMAGQLAEDAKRFDSHGLVLDVDPRQMSLAGQTQQRPPKTDEGKDE